MCCFTRSEQRFPRLSDICGAIIRNLSFTASHKKLKTKMSAFLKYSHGGGEPFYGFYPKYSHLLLVALPMIG